eukprot:6130987-Ditylum_brightwellii.AAC.1
MGTDTKYDKSLRLKNTIIISLLVTKMGKRNCCLNIHFTWETVLNENGLSTQFDSDGLTSIYLQQIKLSRVYYFH